MDAIFIESTEVDKAEPGDNVRLRIKGMEEEDIRMGFVLCDTDALVQVRIVLAMLFFKCLCSCIGHYVI